MLAAGSRTYCIGTDWTIGTLYSWYYLLIIYILMRYFVKEILSNVSILKTECIVNNRKVKFHLVIVCRYRDTIYPIQKYY